MATWTNNNRACTTLWATLYSIGQITTNFVDSGSSKISELVFYTPLDPVLLNTQATTLANQLDDIFINARGAIYEKGITNIAAISNMIQILTDDTKLVSDLATTADATYKFWGE